jgi:3-oxoacyl-[acyl-carrier-protein] synthase II
VRRPVYVHAVGACTPFGGWTQTAAALAEGTTAIRPIDTFDATGFPCTAAAAMPGPASDPDAAIEDRRLLYARRALHDAYGATDAAHLAFAACAPDRIGVFIGAESGRGRFETVLGLSRAARSASGAFDHERFGREARAFAARIDASVISPASVAAALALDVGATGPIETISLACASGGAAIVEAVRAIRLGEVDAALCGGVGADVDPLMVAGFGLLGILSPRGVSCPFDVERDGFIVGEGAAMLVLSAQPPAPGDPVVEIAGIARSLDAYRITAPEPDGDGAARAMAAALRDAGETAVDYVQAHGTSTPLNDRIEVAAIKRVLGGDVSRAHVSSAKGALGHWVAGAGAVGALYAWEAVTHGRILPSAGLRNPDPVCDVNHVIGSAFAKDVRVALANSFAFGGANACLVLRRPA